MGSRDRDHGSHSSAHPQSCSEQLLPSSRLSLATSAILLLPLCRLTCFPLPALPS